MRSEPNTGRAAAEKPVEIIEHRGKHRTESRVFARKIHESYCAQRGCKFFGERAVQGVCFGSETFAGGAWSYIDRAEKYGKAALDETRALWRPGKVNNRKGGLNAYVRYLESCLYTHWVGEVFHLDEMVSLRRRVALLENRIGVKRRGAR